MSIRGLLRCYAKTRILFHAPNCPEIKTHTLFNLFVKWGHVGTDFRQISHPDAVSMLQRHQSHVSWSALSLNSHPWAIEILEQNQDNIDWF